MGKINIKRLARLSSIPIILLACAAHATGGDAPQYIPHEGWDELWREMMIDIVAIGIVFALLTVYLLIRYKRKNPQDAGTAKKLSPVAALGWVLIPVFVFLADDIYLGLENFVHYKKFRNVPQNAYTVEVMSYMWGWEIEYTEGIKTQNEMRVPVGRPVYVKLKSRDVIHTLFMPDFRVKWDALPGTIQYLWFYPTKVGEHVMTCTEFCGTLHSSMHGKVIVMTEDDFSRWVEENKPKEGGAV